MKRYLLAFAISALALGAAVSCQKDNDDDKAVELSAGETANCYVVSAKGTYSFPAVKVNSSEPVGASALQKCCGSLLDTRCSLTLAIS